MIKVFEKLQYVAETINLILVPGFLLPFNCTEPAPVSVQEGEIF